MGIGELWFLSMAVPANFLTNWIVGDVEKLTDYFNTFVSNGLGNLIVAIILLIIGITISIKNSKHKAEE
ncbi:hypothetical protein [Roseburia sp. 499]|uniref:hypothetical protein n=1 Tax=Roseburia sp. 499 TaxID=1261634 RepID=UPI00095340CB|nr:hypothetical protein [Roseburia sp. 499]WVK71076.1 hypothetical protein BIV20_05930 [Roseburia sp. 499]